MYVPAEHTSNADSSAVLNTFGVGFKWHECALANPSRCKVKFWLDARRLSPHWGTSNWINLRRIYLPLGLAGQVGFGIWGAGPFVVPARPSHQAFQLRLLSVLRRRASTVKAQLLMQQASVEADGRIIILLDVQSI